MPTTQLINEIAVKYNEKYTPQSGYVPVTGENRESLLFVRGGEEKFLLHSFEMENTTVLFLDYEFPGDLSLTFINRLVFAIAHELFTRCFFNKYFFVEWGKLIIRDIFNLSDPKLLNNDITNIINNALAETADLSRSLANSINLLDSISLN